MKLKELLPKSIKEFEKAFNTRAKKNGVVSKVEEAFDAVRLLLVEGEYILKRRYRLARDLRDSDADNKSCAATEVASSSSVLMVLLLLMPGRST